MFIDPALAACAPHVSPVTLSRIISVESSGNPNAVNVNVIRGRARYPTPRIRSAAHGAEVARDAISKGFNVDLGLMQVNSRNLANLGYTIEQMFEPCTNIRAGARVLTENYQRAVRQYPEGQQALLAALSAYNTGNFRNGFSNGYIARYFNTRSAIITVQPPVIPSANSPAEGGEVAEPVNPYTADLSVFSRERVSYDGNSQPAIGNAGSSDPTNSVRVD